MRPYPGDLTPVILAVAGALCPHGHARQVQKHGEPGGPFDEGADAPQARDPSG
jgi:hypothetical protein